MCRIGYSTGIQGILIEEKLDLILLSKSNKSDFESFFNQRQKMLSQSFLVKERLLDIYVRIAGQEGGFRLSSLWLFLICSSSNLHVFSQFQPTTSTAFQVFSMTIAFCYLAHVIMNPFVIWDIMQKWGSVITLTSFHHLAVTKYICFTTDPALLSSP